MASVAAGQSATPSDEIVPPDSIALPATETPPAPDSGAKPEAPKDKPDASKEKPKRADAGKLSDRGPEYLAQCLRDWDAGTHMTRQEWARTCRRVVSNRLKFLRSQGQ